MITAHIRVGSTVNYEIDAPSSFLFNVAAARTPHQSIETESIDCSPALEIRPCEAGQHNRLHRVLCERGALEISYTADVCVKMLATEASEIEEQSYLELPADVLIYLNPSRYCESDKLIEFARRQFGDLPTGHSRVQAICEWTFHHLSYTAGVTNSSTTACDVLLGRSGVCRDFAHLAIAMCRSAGIPARYVSGYVVDLAPPDFHGFFEAYLDGRWYHFDPSGKADLGRIVRISTGRDAADTPFATVVGSARLERLDVWAHALEQAPGADIDQTQTGISTA